MTDNESKILTVSQLNEYIKMLLDGTPTLSNVYIKGEISNFTNHRTGHLYFTLKDEGAVLKSVMFRSSASRLMFMPEDGMRVVARGRISVFPASGQYQLYCEDIQPDGVGALYIAYEQLKRKLEAEGLFRDDIKRPLPKIPTRIGIITSPTGAAIRDMINITGRRFPYAEIILYPSLVQGDGAPTQLIAGLKYFNDSKRCDVIIIGRGGGSIEDLWAFNNEGLARAVRESKIPVISAVGHETDFTICDFAADRRAPTPSAAAELAVPDTAELMRKINNIIGRMELLLSQNINLRRKTLEQLASQRVIKNPKNLIDDRRMRLLNLEEKLSSSVQITVKNKQNTFIQYTSKLEALNPLAVISRGYSAVFKPDGSLVKSIDNISVGDKLNFRLADGVVEAVAEKITDNIGEK